MLEECNLHTIVRLPKSVFAPYTTIATNVLFLTKGEPTKDIWYYEHQLPEGVKAYNKTKPMRLSEFDEEKKWWTKRKETEKAWKVSAKDIAANNYNLDIKNPNTPIETHEDPEELLLQYAEAVKAVKALQDQLKTSLQQSLGN
jgi:type I restriction enzyme M protein